MLVLLHRYPSPVNCGPVRSRLTGALCIRRSDLTSSPEKLIETDKLLSYFVAVYALEGML